MAHEITVESLLAHADWVRSLARSLVADEHRADDVVQQTWLEALERPPKHARNLRSWLGQVARNVAAATGRSEARRRRREQARPLPRKEVPSPEELLQRASVQRCVVDAVLALHEPYRTTVLYRYFHELTPAEIAAVQSISVETVRTRLKRALKLLQDRLAGELGDSSHGLSALLPLTGLPHRTPSPGSSAARTPTATQPAAAGLAAASAPALILGVLAMTHKLSIGLVAILALGASIVTFQLLGESEPETVEVLAPEAHRARPQLEAVRGEDEAPGEAAPLERLDREISPTSPSVNDPDPSPAAGEASACVVSGRVTSAQGEPVAGAKVLAAPTGGSVHWDRKQRLLWMLTDLLDDARADGESIFETWTDENGEYRLPGLPPGPSWNLAALHAELGIALEPRQSLELEGSPYRFDFRLLGGVSFFGTVTDDVGAPLPGASVVFSGAEEGSYQGVAFLETDAEGRYRTVPLPFPRQSVTVEAEGYFLAHEQIELPSFSSGERELSFELKPAPLLEGRILDLDGRPAGLRSVIGVAGEGTPGDDRLRLLGSTQRPEDQVGFLASFRRAGRVLIDEDRYQFQTNQRGLRFLSLWWDETWLGTAEIRLTEPNDLRIDSRQIRAARLVGSLDVWAREAGSRDPVTAYRLRLLRVKEGTPGRYEAQESGRGEVRDESGHVRIDDLEWGTYRVVVSADGWAPAWREVSIEEGAATELTVDLERAVAQVSGRVLGPDGEPLNGAVAHLLRPDGELVSLLGESKAKTNAKGEFAFEALPEGDYMVVAEVGGPMQTLSPAAKRVSARPGSRVDLRLEEGSLLELNVSGSDGPFQYRVLDRHGIPLFDDLRRGALRFGNPFWVRVPPGRYTVEVLSPGYRTGRRECLAKPGLAVEVQLEQR